MPVFDLNEALERAVEEENKVPKKEPPLVLPPRNVVPISYGRKPAGLHISNDKAQESGTFSPRPPPIRTAGPFPTDGQVAAYCSPRADGDAPCS